MSTNPLRRHFTYTIKDFFVEFKNFKKSTGKRVKDIIGYKTYRGIIEGFFVGILKKIIFENFTFMMPYGLGIQVVTGKQTNYKDARIDYDKTIKNKKVIKHLNQHTFGYYYYCKWDKSVCCFRNKAYYNFRLTGTPYAAKDGIGRGVLSKHIKNTSSDPDTNSYIRI